MCIRDRREVGSIGTGNAATALSALLGCEVRIPLPEVQVLEFNDAVEKLGGFETVSAGIISSLSGEINGLMLALVQLDAINLIQMCIRDSVYPDADDRLCCF